MTYNPQEAYNNSPYAGGQVQMEQSPLLGYGDDAEVRRFKTDPGRGGFSTWTEMAPEEIRQQNVLDQIGQLSEEEQRWLALDMATALPVGVAYSSLDDVFLEDGSLNMAEFNNALSRTLKEAQLAGPEGFDTTTLFLDILTQNRDASPEELRALFEQRKSANARGGRVISYVDPVALMAAADDAFSSVTGRRASDIEKQSFVQAFHKLQASGATGLNVGARAESAAREAAPEEAAAMDYAGAAGVLMQALGIRGR